jgi:hypothetical protein
VQGDPPSVYVSRVSQERWRCCAERVSQNIASFDSLGAALGETLCFSLTTAPTRISAGGLPELSPSALVARYVNIALLPELIHDRHQMGLRDAGTASRSAIAPDPGP